jgi:hypothetical protein
MHRPRGSDILTTLIGGTLLMFVFIVGVVWFASLF